MDWSSTHAGYVIAAFAISAIALLAMGLWVIGRDRALRNQQREPEKK
jgi:heme exporter protein CcmD